MIYMKKNEIAYHDSSAKITYSNRAFCENNRVQSKQQYHAYDDSVIT